MVKKKTTPTDLLCRGFPPEFGVFLNYTRDFFVRAYGRGQSGCSVEGGGAATGATEKA